ncbi:MAG: molybdopterin-dependent oxidoreductase [Saprospiraceae bacterium]|nr:molybdopterin-dependent oxidoreductase [Saprospiraceae bacterium]
MKRREFVQIATIGSATIFQACETQDNEITDKGEVAAEESKKEEIASACWQCVSRCSILAYKKGNRLVKIEGNPLSLRNEGKVCAKGQAGINQMYNPDRLLYPLRRIGERGSGKWERISWETALDLLLEGGEIEGAKVKGLRRLRKEGNPEKFLFHYGRMVGTDYSIIIHYFLSAFGTSSIGNHDSICNRAGSIARRLTGDVTASKKFDDVDIVLNFGRSLIDAGIDHIPIIRRISRMLERGVKIYTFDVRLSNTAAKSHKWVPVKPGTDLAVVLALSHVLLREGLYDKEGIEQTANVTVDKLISHLEPYTPQWAEKISGVPADLLEQIAIEYGNATSGACTSFRGAFMHFNGVQAQRAIYMLDVIAGNIGPEVRKTKRAQWNYPFPRPEKPTAQLPIFNGDKGQFAVPDGSISHQILSQIKKGKGRPELYMVYCHNPVYANGNCNENIEIYKDTKQIPFLVSVDVGMSETTMLADLVLPDASFLERWTAEVKGTRDGIPEYYIRQPVHEPLGESRNFVDVACHLAKELDLNLGFDSAEDFIKGACQTTDGIKEAGGFEYMKEHGIWHDKTAQVEFVKREKLNLFSERLDKSGHAGLPTWMIHPDHQRLDGNELILTTFKVNVHTHSRTQNCKWLMEIYHENPAWINAATADRLGIQENDWIKLESHIGELITKAKITQGVHPQAISISHHLGHWAFGEYASGKASPINVKNDSDSGLVWWDNYGMHLNKIIPNYGDPISGAMCWNDTVVSVSKIS